MSAFYVVFLFPVVAFVVVIHPRFTRPMNIVLCLTLCIYYLMNNATSCFALKSSFHYFDLLIFSFKYVRFPFRISIYHTLYSMCKIRALFSRNFQDISRGINIFPKLPSPKTNLFEITPRIY